MSKTTRRNITFELPEAEFEALERDAAGSRATSRHQRARDIVVDYLANGGVTDLAEAIGRIDAEVAYLQELVRRLAFSVIVHAGDRPSEDANQWIRQHMPLEPPKSLANRRAPK